MGLKDIVIPRRDIPFGGTTISVRGASAFDTEILMTTFATDAVVAYGKLRLLAAKKKSANKKFDEGDVLDMVKDLLQSVPDLVAGLIAICADEPEYADAVKKLPIAIQMQILFDIWELTFTSEAELKKLAAGILGAVETMTALVLDAHATTQKLSNSGG